MNFSETCVVGLVEGCECGAGRDWPKPGVGSAPASAAAKVELAKAQDDLKESVTKAPQEAALVSIGILE